MAAIGIDFGNTYCRVGIFRSNNAFEIIPSETQSRQTPCYVSFKSWSDTIVGDLALNRVVENIEATFFCPKRLIGRSYEEITQQIRHSHWPFRVKDGGEKRPVFQVAYQDMERDIHPIEVYSAVLYKVRELASNYLQENVVRAVITIPINCGESFVKDALKSAEMAGFTEVNLIEKPLSATIAYSISATKCNAQYVIAVHLGGGSLGVSVVNISPNGIKPIFSDGDPNIGGVNIDAAIVTWLQQKLNILPDPSGQTSMHLSILCERAKKNLSSCKETSIKLDDVAGKDDIIRITQDDITEMEDVQKMLGKMKNIMKRAMSAISSTERAAVILVGGSTRLKCVRDVIDSFGIKSNRILSAEEVAVHGAAVLAAKLWPIQSPTDAASDLINIQLLTTIPWKANQLVTGCPQSSQTTYIDDQSKDLGDRSALLNDIESNIYEIQRIIRGELDAKKKEDVTQKCKMALDWLKRDPIPTMNEITKVKDKVERWKSDVDKEMVSGDMRLFCTISISTHIQYLATLYLYTQCDYFALNMQRFNIYRVS